MLRMHAVYTYAGGAVGVFHVEHDAVYYVCIELYALWLDGMEEEAKEWEG